MTKTIYLLLTMYFYQDVSPPGFTSIFDTYEECETAKAQQTMLAYHEMRKDIKLKSVCMKVDRDFWN